MAQPHSQGLLGFQNGCRKPRRPRERGCLVAKSASATKNGGLSADSSEGLFILQKVKIMNAWSREDVSACSCSARTYRHVHCPCLQCRGAATDRTTELRHWRENCLLNNPPGSLADDIDSDHESLASPSSSASPSAPGAAEDYESFSQGSDANNANPISPEFESVEPADCQGTEPLINPLKIMDESGSSIKTFDDILIYGKRLLYTLIDGSVDLDVLSTMWPKNWNEVQLLLKEEGFEDAKEYFICFCRTEKVITRNDKTHTKFVYSGNFSVMDNKNACCTKCEKKGYLKYYYLGLENKVKNWFKTESMCKKMLSHWNQREHWLGREESWPLKQEFWDGQRWIDIQWFWDPSKVWPLPTLCVHCNAVISVDHLTASPEGINSLKIVTCPECFETFHHCIKMARGSPLNLALIGHWDGWQPFGTSFRGCGSIEVSIANMKKTDRCHVDEVYVVGFVPCSDLPKDLPEYLDPFLKPLMDDLSNGFISGYKIAYPLQFTSDEFHSSETETVRLLLLCWTGDHPGQCEVGKFLNQGKCGCRREKLQGQQLQNSSNNHYYYGSNRYHCRYPCEKRQIEQELENLYDIENETRTSVRKTMSSKLGFTGISLLHKVLYPLYKFDVTKHMV